MSKTLKDCCSFQEGYVNPSQKIREYFGSDVRWLRAVDLNNDEVFETSARLSEKGYKSAGSSAFMFPKNSLAISKSGSIGTLGILRNEMCGNRAIINIDVKENADLDYIFYLLRHKNREIQAKAVGSVQKNLYISELETIKLCHDDIEEQKLIASILKPIDAKIRLNNAIISELEAMAKDIYDYWFVQFDFPDASGKPYKSSGGKMVWNEDLRREIPRGWVSTKLGNLISHNRGVSYTGADIGTEGTPIISLASIDKSGRYVLDGIKYYNHEYPKEKVLKPFDLIMANTDMTQERAVLGKIIFVPDLFDGDILSTHHITKITVSEELKSYLMMTTQTEWFHHYIQGFSSGTNVLGLNMKGFEDYTTVLPNGNILEKYSTIVRLLYNKVFLLQKEILGLETLRDWLLPMLMNGQVKVS